MSSIDNILNRNDYLLKDLDAVRLMIRENLITGNPGMDRALSRFSEAPGKMLRPAMVMLSSRFGDSFDESKAHRLAAAIEILHIATLVHDDIIDESPTRRGVPTLHITDGTRKAVLLGDYLFTRCFRLVAETASSDAASMLAAVVARVCESEMAQADDNGMSRRLYLRNIAGKTALLFILSLSVGARENGGSETVVRTLREAGFGIGMSFQLVDDILDYDGQESRMGKPAGKDISSGLITLPVILTSEAGDPDVIRLLGGKPSRRKSSRLRQAVIAAGGLKLTRDVAGLYNYQALKRIETLPDIPARQALRDLAEVITVRNN